VTRLLQLTGGAVTAALCVVLLVLAFSAGRLAHRAGAPQARTPAAHSADLKWNASASPVVGYNVYRSEKTGGPFAKLTGAPIRETRYTDRTVQSAHTYFYMVTAVDGQGRESLYSNQIKAVIPSP
jgi:fibronectin type 3 domain-containing protein